MHTGRVPMWRYTPSRGKCILAGGPSCVRSWYSSWWHDNEADCMLQAYVVCELSDKVNILWGFIKTHLKVCLLSRHRSSVSACTSFIQKVCAGVYQQCRAIELALFVQAKTLVFLSTCKQVKYMYSVFKKLQPGVPLRCMHGGMSQIKRMAVFYEFTEVCLLFNIAIADFLHSSHHTQDYTHPSKSPSCGCKINSQMNLLACLVIFVILGLARTRRVRCCLQQT